MRALRVLGEVDFILCEDTRVTRVLLDHYNIKTGTISYHQHSGEEKIKDILDLLARGKNLALVSDAGTPGISDPGGKLVRAVLEKFGDEIHIESVPGPSAVTAALSRSGIPTDKFIFMGFPPHKKGRQTFIRKILQSEFPVVVYESKHRILKLLDELGKMTNEDRDKDDEIKNYEPAYRTGRLKITNNEKQNKGNPLTSVVVCRELSKMHETVYRGDLKSITEKIKADKNDQKGEFVVIIGK
jgi:16S rRNA (cytidine1402-2'-O)-methyltransferase